MNVLTRRSVLACGAAAAVAVPAAASTLPADLPDAELVRVCHEFAEAEFRNWWRYIVAPADLADAQDREPDWPTLAWIEATPATTPAGWHAKALAYAAWWREADDNADPESDSDAPLLASLLRDMVAPTRAAILARCEAEYGPLGKGYTADGRWIGPAPVAVTAALLPIPLHADAELLVACAAFTHAGEEVARLEHTAGVPDDVFEPVNDALHDAVVRVSGLRPRTVGGLRAKAAVCRAVLAADEPAAAAGRFGSAARRHDVLAWAVLGDLVEVAG